MKKLDNILSPYKDYGVIFIRLIVGFHLIYGTQDNVFSYERMLEFVEFLRSHQVPLPLFSAFLSVYAQFICGILYIIGWKVRFTAIIMIINFIFALIIAHIGEPYPVNFPALVMLLSSIALLFLGAGYLSFDKGFSSSTKR